MSGRSGSESDSHNAKPRTMRRFLLLTTKRGYAFGSFATFLIIALPILLNTNQASGLLIPINEAYSYETGWMMPSSIDVEGMIQPRIIVTSYNASAISGKIVDSSGDTLTFYGEESRVMVRWGYGGGFVSDWSIGATPENGLFTVIIPYGFKDVNSCRLYVNGNRYVIGPSTNGSKIYNYTDTTIWEMENHFKIKAPNANPDEDWYVYYGQIPVRVNSASLSYKMS